MRGAEGSEIQAHPQPHNKFRLATVDPVFRKIHNNKMQQMWREEAAQLATSTVPTFPTYQRNPNTEVWTGAGTK